MATVKGIDLSKWQGKVDFNKVKSDGIKFVVLREGYRRTIDSRFIEYVNGAKKAGIDILGVYHFIYFDSATPAQNADACVANMKKAGLDIKKHWVFADLEYDAWTSAGIKASKTLCTRYTKEFIDELKRLGCAKIGIYCNMDYYKNYYDWTKLAEYKKYIWLADISGGPDVNCMMQQYSFKGKVNGINADVDMNKLFDDSILNESKKTESVKSVEAIAKEVIAGKWGVGTERKERLTAAGYDYKTVQSTVNAMLKK